jgi:hypothetical protein
LLFLDMERRANHLETMTKGHPVALPEAYTTAMNQQFSFSYGSHHQFPYQQRMARLASAAIRNYAFGPWLTAPNLQHRST